jgi:hypothetical protein
MKLGFTGDVEFVRGSLQVCGRSAKNSVNSGGASREKRKGGEGGDAGLFIASSSLQEGLGFERW